VARLTIEECWWTDPRRSALGRLVGGEDTADVIAVRAWKVAQEYWKRNRLPVPQDIFDCLQGAAELIQVKLAVVRDDGVYVRGSSDYLDWAFEQRELARAAGKKSAEARRAKLGSAQPKPRTGAERPSNGPRTKPNDSELSVSVSVSGSDSVSDSGFELIAPGSEKSAAAGASASAGCGDAGKGGFNPDGGSATALAWRAYRDAYAKRHGQAPPWNAKTAGQLKQFVSRIPASDAPAVAEFYLSHGGYRYASAMHPVGLLLMDAEKLYTEWSTGRKVTQSQARQSDKTAGYQSQLERIASGEL
jgi:hypothetical protein